MILEKSIGKAQDFPCSKIEYLDIEWYNSCKKIDRLKTRDGREVGIRLNDETVARGLKQGDALAHIDETIIVVDIIPCECLVIDIVDPHQLPKFCYEIGNRHAPFFYGENHHQFVTPYEKPMQVMIEKLGLEVRVETVKINLGHSISSSNGGHSHDHH